MPEDSPLLQVGQKFRMHPSCGIPYIWEVLRVTPSSATVRCLAKDHTTILDAEGEVKADFWRPGKPVQISAHSQIILIPADEEPT